MLVMQRPKVEALGDADGSRGIFAIAPLEPGFGHTLGNSLRRTLLSSIPGAAVTQVRFDDSLHEFDTIKGVVEDVTDIILNLKDLVLRSHSDEMVTLRLDAKGPGVVTAGDIEINPEIEVLNPELEIATLNGLWGVLVIAAEDPNLTNPPRGVAVNFVSWIEKGFPLNPDSVPVQQMAAALMAYNLATAEQVQQLSDAANTPQTITQQQVGAAREWHRVTGGATNGTA